MVEASSDCPVCGGTHDADNPIQVDELELLTEAQYQYVHAMESLQAWEWVHANRPQSIEEYAAQRDTPVENYSAMRQAQEEEGVRVAADALRKASGQGAPARIWAFMKQLGEIEDARRSARQDTKDSEGGA